MNTQQAKEILLLYRPDAADAADPMFAAALELAGQDEELQRWFEARCAAQRAISQRFKTIPVPEGLKEQIISERPWQTKEVSSRHIAVLAAVAVLAVVVALVFQWVRQRESTGFAAYRSRMIDVALEGYGMSIESGDERQVRAYLTERHAPADYALPAGLAKFTVTGCVVLSWHEKPVSMICFHTGQENVANDLWLIVADRASVRGAPDTSTPQITQIRNLPAATWTADGRTYLLALRGSEASLKSILHL